MNRFIFALALSTFAFISGSAQRPPPVLNRDNASYTVDLYGVTMAGDSAKYVLFWKQPLDTFGLADSTIYNLTSSKPVVFYGSAAVSPPNVRVRRVKKTLADSVKFARPLPGDSVVFQINGFVQCRKGDCSEPGSAGWKWVVTWAPAPSAPTITGPVVF